MAAGVPGGAGNEPSLHAFAVYRTPTESNSCSSGWCGRNVGNRFPVPGVRGSAEGMSPDAVLYDVSDRDQIQVTVLPAK